MASRAQELETAKAILAEALFCSLKQDAPGHLCQNPPQLQLLGVIAKCPLIQPVLRAFQELRQLCIFKKEFAQVPACVSGNGQMALNLINQLRIFHFFHMHLFFGKALIQA
jgi:hypothetical protein